jgi:anaerobic magnesium-protoporphyrin IX monomethyl ester cyclase
MKTLFVYPTPDRAQVFHHGIGYLSAALKSQGHETSLLLAADFDQRAVHSAVESFGPGLVCITAASNQNHLSREITRSIYEAFQLPIVIGGVHCSFTPEESLAVNGVMAACIGEGEAPLLELVQALETGRDYTAIPNLWFSGGHTYRMNGSPAAVPGQGVIRNPVRAPLEDLDQLPFPDRELFLPYARGEERLDFMASRGCPFGCAYCFHEQYRKLFPRGHRYCRHRSPANVIEEIRRARVMFQSMRTINFHDDTFNLSKAWVQEFTSRYAAEIGLPFECSLEAHLADEETVALLAKSGCFHVFIGVETGSAKLRREVLNKKVTDEELLRTFGWARKHGLRTTAHYMIGIPYETEATLWEGVELAREMKPDCCSPTIFYPFPGTELYQLCHREGWVSQRSATSYYYGSVLDQPSVSHVVVERYRLLFPRLIRHDLLYTLCRWRPAAFALGSALRFLQKVKRSIKSI